MVPAIISLIMQETRFHMSGEIEELSFVHLGSTAIILIILKSRLE